MGFICLRLLALFSKNSSKEEQGKTILMKTLENVQNKESWRDTWKTQGFSWAQICYGNMCDIQ